LQDNCIYYALILSEVEGSVADRETSFDFAQDEVAAWLSKSRIRQRLPYFKGQYRQRASRRSHDQRPN